MSVNDIIELIDAGLGSAAGWSAPIHASACARVGCKHPPEPAHDFCAPCLAWLRGDADDDPLGPHLPPEDQPDDVDSITRWVEMFGGPL